MYRILDLCKYPLLLPNIIYLKLPSKARCVTCFIIRVTCVTVIRITELTLYYNIFVMCNTDIMQPLIVVLLFILINIKLFCQQMHLLLKHKMLQILFKISLLIWLLHISVPSDHHQGAYDGTLLKLVSLKALVKTHR